MSTDLSTCALCPRLCRDQCPVSIGSGREATTPTSIMTTVLMAKNNADLQSQAAQAVDLCTRCGQCTSACGLDMPVVDMLDKARTLLQPAPGPWVPPIIKGNARQVAIISGDIDWAPALAKVLNEDVAVLHTDDFLGAAHQWRTDTKEAHTALLKQLFQHRTAITADHTCAQVIDTTDIPTESLHSLLPAQNMPHWRSCHEPNEGRAIQTITKCCGAAGPLQTAHPDIANEVGRDVARRLDGQQVYSTDDRCARHLQTCGAAVTGPVEWLMSQGDPDADR